MAQKHKISERTLYLISLLVGVLFLGNIYYHLHVAPNWQWGPALDKMPKHMVSDFRAEIYENGKGGYALQEYIDPNAEFDRDAFPRSEERRVGKEVRWSGWTDQCKTKQ